MIADMESRQVQIVNDYPPKGGQYERNFIPAKKNGSFMIFMAAMSSDKMIESDFPFHIDRRSG
jgi:hypothetical protein